MSNEARLKRFVTDLEELLENLAEDTDDSSFEEALEASPPGPNRVLARSEAAAPLEKIPLPASLVVQDETKKAKR